MKYILEIESHKDPEEIEWLRKYIGRKNVFCFDDDTIYGNDYNTKDFSEQFGYPNGRKGLKCTAKLIRVGRTENIDHWFAILWNEYRTIIKFEIDTTKTASRYKPSSYGWYEDEYAVYRGRSADGSGFTGNPFI